MTVEDYSLVVKKAPDGSLSTPDVDGESSGIHVLRPQPGNEEGPTSSYLEGDGNGDMRLLHMDKLVEMFNTSITEHGCQPDATCPCPQFEVADEIKKGICWKMSVKCKCCKYTSVRYNLYEEVASNKRGPKYAKPNLGLQVGLQETPISKTKARVLFACMNTPPPCNNSLQEAANKVGDLTAVAAEKDLEKRCQRVKDINRMRGLPETSPINVSIDVRYNSNVIAARGKMGQNASQAIATCIENQTDQKQIIGISMGNKLCQKGASLRSKGIGVACPGHPGCSANQKSVVPFSEHELGKNLGTDLARQGVRVRYATTDGDARSAEGVKSAMMEAATNCKTERKADTTHQAQGLFRHVLKAKFSEGMFPGDTKAKKKQQQQMLAHDMRYRCQWVHRETYKSTAGNMTAMHRKMPYAIDATIECYSGNCKNCRRHSVVCKGGSKSWRAKSSFLTSCEATDLRPTENDKLVMRSLLNFYLGRKALDLMSTNCNTNRNEAVNRSISASLPKNVNFARNGPARALASVSRVNKGTGKAIIDSLEVVGSAITKGGGAAKAIHGLQKTSRYHKKRSQSCRAKSQRKKRTQTQMKAFLKAKAERLTADYCKGQLDPELELPAKLLRKRVKLDHNYNEVPNVGIVADHNYMDDDDE
jgi:hypothetical protein